MLFTTGQFREMDILCADAGRAVTGLEEQDSV
jgi:hypothetical protein